MKPDYRAFEQLETRGWSSAQTVSGYTEAFSQLTAMCVPALVSSVAAKKGDRVLDICCGPGVVTRGLAETGASVTGLDFSAVMLEKAKEVEPRAYYVRGDAQKLPFDDNWFDAATIGFGLQHLSDPNAALSEVHRVLRPRGKLAITNWLGTGAFELIADGIRNAGANQHKLPIGPDPLILANCDGLRRMFRQAGYSDFKSDTIEPFWTIESPSNLFDFFQRGSIRFAETLAHLDDETLEVVRSAIAKAVIDRLGDRSPWKIKMPACLVAGTKATGH